MAKQVLLNVRTFAGGADLTGQSNKVEIGAEVEDKDATPYRPVGQGGWKEILGGLASVSITGSGQWEAGDPGLVDDATWAAIQRRAPVPWTICPLSAAEGELAYATTALTTSYKQGEAVGEVAPWEANASGNGLATRGTVMHSPGTARTATGDGTGAELGALAAGQRMLAVLHVLSASGTTPELTVSVESDADNTFSAPTVRGTFDMADSPGGQALTVAGPVTDTWWRLSWVISGTTPSFLFVASLGIA